MEFFILLLLTVCFFSSCLHRVIKRLNDGWTNFLLHLRFAVFKCVYINDCCCCSLDSYELFASDENCRRCEWFCWLLLTKNSAIFFLLSFHKFVWFNCIERTISVRLYDVFHPENLITLNWAPIVCSIETIFPSILLATNFWLKNFWLHTLYFVLVSSFYLRFS